MNLRTAQAFLLIAFAAMTLPACTTVTDENGVSRLSWRTGGTPVKVSPEPERPKNITPSGHYLFVDQARLDALTPSETRIDLNLSKQRAKILNGNGELVIETQISTGTSNHRTPTGQFSILEKIVDKRSNRYGRWVNASSGSTIVSDGDSYKKPSGNAKFVGTQMPYWMRVTWYGIGMHIGYVPDYAASHGCIRVPAHIQPTIYSKVRVGTPVNIHY